MMTHSTDDFLYHKAADLLRGARYGVALTGAGISTPSGIPDFRSPHSGLWENVDPMTVASIYGFRRDPRKFYEWIRPLTRLMINAKPNSAHYALADLEGRGYIRGVITQNIDDLHTRAGSKCIHEVHGHMRSSTCVECFTIQPTEGEALELFIEDGVIPRCQRCGGILKPNVILFGEQLPVKTLMDAQGMTDQADVMLVAGSSLVVAPVSDLPSRALAQGAKLIIINYEETYLDRQASVVIHDDVARVLPRIVSLLEGDRA